MSKLNPNDIDAVVRELREAQAAAVRTDKNALARDATWGDQADAQKASDLYHALCFRHMPAILEALERVTGERDAAMGVVNANEYQYGWEKSKLQRTHPHLFKTESDS